MAQFSDGVMNILMDVSQCASAPDIYDMLVLESKTRRGRLEGNTISGLLVMFRLSTFASNPGCKGMGVWQFQIGPFYSNFMNDSRYLREGFSIQTLNEKLNVSFVPEWAVSSCRYDG